MSDPVYRRDGDLFHPAAYAAGPFGGQHGGGVAGLLAACMEQEAAATGGGLLLQLTVYYPRPTPLVPVKVTVDTARAGGRMTLVTAHLQADGKWCAQATGVFVRGAPVGSLSPEPNAPPEPPDDLPRRPYVSPLFPHLHLGPEPQEGEAWLPRTFEGREDGAGGYWMRMLRPLCEPLTDMARLAAMVDTASGLVSRAEGNVAAFPNPDLTIHLHRAPVGEWVRMRPHAIWHEDGYGLCDTELADVQGYLGRSSQSLVLVPRRE